jgi:mannose-1-phosphate guanylyltransferase
LIATATVQEIFPQMASEGHLYAMELPGFWMDVGQPKDFLAGSGLYLNHLSETNSSMLASGKSIVPPVLIVCV